jgi:hypothetical protein
MSTHAGRDRLVEYLLGDLSDDQRLEIEQQYFKDDDVYEALLAVENELTYDYAAGTLSPAERQRFEQRFLGTAEQRARVETARALLRSVRPARPRTAWMRPLAAAAVLVLVAAGWLAVDLARRANAPERAPIDVPPGTAAAPGTPGPVPSAPPPPAGKAPAQRPLAIAVTLQPGLARSTDSATRIVIPPGAGVLRLQLAMPSTAVESYRSYRVSIRNAADVEVWGRAPVPPAKPLVIEVPPLALPAGDYELVLSGTTAASTSEDLAEYYFRVVRR